jgi:hypothetical protein
VVDPLTRGEEAQMPMLSKYVFIASMDVAPDKEALFNEVYDREHVPNLLRVPGVRAVTRLRGDAFAISIGGEEKRVEVEGPRYSAVYEIDGPQVLVSPEWAAAVEAGRWPGEVRPRTRNRRHGLFKVC